MSEITFKQLNLDENIEKAIALCGYTIPTPVQAKSIPPILEGKDVVASAQTGTGKTAAFVLPALDRLSKEKPSKKTRILILTPTRELAAQITKAATQYGKFLRFNFVNLVGGMPYNQQIRELSRGADIIVATPGRLLDHIESKRVDLSGIEMLILDEADRMLDMGFIEDVEYIAKLTPAERQTLLFSATVDKQLTNVVRHLLKNPVRIDLSNEKLTVPQIDQQLYKANNIHHKSKLLKHFLNDKNIFKAIIFSATKVNADRIADQLCDDGFAAAALHGDLRQNVRTRTIEQLRRGKIQFLVATDVAARGIDISDVTHVINYDLPRFCEDYVHRIGRTGRAGKTGVAISFVLPTETRNLQRIERYIGQRLQLISNLDVGQNESRGEAREPRESREPREFRERSRDHGRSFEKPEFKPFRKRFEDRDGGRSERSSEGYSDRKPSFRSREDKPFKKRFEGKEGGKSPFARAERSSERSSERSTEGYSDRKPAFRTSREDKPFKKRFEGRDSGGRSSERSSDSKREARPAFRHREDKPFKRTTEKSGDSWRSASNQDSRISYRDKSEKPAARKPFGKSFGGGKSNADGNRPFKKRAERRDRAE